jgi:hypothetical protein
MDGDDLRIGDHDWKVITVFGHAPEHAALWCESLNVLISGDQVLPRITTNVGVWGNQPDSNPLALFLGRSGSSRIFRPMRSCCLRTTACSAAAPAHRAAARPPRARSSGC